MFLTYIVSMRSLLNKSAPSTLGDLQFFQNNKVGAFLNYRTVFPRTVERGHPPKWDKNPLY